MRFVSFEVTALEFLVVSKVVKRLKVTNLDTIWSNEDTAVW